MVLLNNSSKREAPRSTRQPSDPQLVISQIFPVRRGAGTRGIFMMDATFARVVFAELFGHFFFYAPKTTYPIRRSISGSLSTCQDMKRLSGGWPLSGLGERDSGEKCWGTMAGGHAALGTVLVRRKANNRPKGELSREGEDDATSRSNTRHPRPFLHSRVV